MINAYKLYAAKFNKLSPRERIFTLLALLLLLFAVWYLVLWQNIYAARNNAKQQIQKTEKNLTSLNAKITTSTVALQKVTSELLSQQKIAATKLAQQPGKPLTPSQLQLVSAQKIVEILQHLLNQRHDLELLEVKKMPARLLTADSLGNITGGLYEHAITIKLRGSYFAILHYLQDIEKQNLHIFWDSLQYKVIKYPMAEVVLQLHTLSNKKDWIYV